MKINISLDTKQLSKALMQLGTTEAKHAASMAINRVLPGVRTEAKKVIKEKTKLRRIGSIFRRMVITKSTRSTLAGSIEFPGGIPLVDYKGARHKKGKGGGVFQDGEKHEHSFKASIKSIKNDFFYRVDGYQKGQAGYRIKRLYAYTVTQQYRHHKVEDILTREAQKRMGKEFGRAIAQKARKLGLSR